MEPHNILQNQISTLSLHSNLCKTDYVGRKFFGLNSRLRKFSVMVLDGIDIKPRNPNSTILHLKQNFLFPSNYRNMVQMSAEQCTQTSLTKLNKIGKERCSETRVSLAGDWRLIAPKCSDRRGAWYIRPQSVKQMVKKSIGARKPKVSVNTLTVSSKNQVLSEEEIRGDQENLKAKMNVEARIEAAIEALHEHNW